MAHGQGDSFDLIERTPGAAGAVVIVDDAERVWTSEPGRVAFEAARRTGSFARTREAWADLARRLGVGEAEAARLLIAGRLWIALEELPELDSMLDVGVAVGLADRDVAPGDWAAMTEALPDGLARVRARLKPQLRGAGGRVSVYAIEGGRYQIAIGAVRDGLAPVLIGPGPDSPMFDASLPLLVGDDGLDPWRGDPSVEELRAIGPGADVLFASRRLGAGGFQAGAVLITPGLVRIAHRSAPNAGWGDGKQCEAGSLWAPAEAEAAIDGMVFAVLGVLPPGAGERAEALAQVAQFPVLAPVAPLVPLVGERMSFALWRRNVAESGSPLGVGVAMAVNPIIAPERARAMADRLIGQAVDPAGDGGGFEGAFPRAVRTVALGDDTGGTVAAWKFGQAIPGELGAGGGEWMGFAFDDRERAVGWLDRISVGAAPAGDSGVVAAGRIELAELRRVLAQRQIPLPTFIDAIRRIGWWAIYEPTGGVGGRAVIETTASFELVPAG
ncbi:MAG: hypothetical protein AAGB51_07435 [Planctomycetota bacterium]